MESGLGGWGGALRRALTIGLVVSALGVASVAGAVTLTASAPQTESGQDFAFTFNGVPVSDGLDGLLTIHARGDYQAANPTEFLTWDIDFLGIGAVAGPLTGFATILLDNGPNDVEWMQTFVIPGAALLQATSDGVLTALLDLNLDPNFVGVNHLFDTDFASVRIDYAQAIPEPTAALLYGCGALVFAGARTRRR